MTVPTRFPFRRGGKWVDGIDLRDILECYYYILKYCL